ncbi:hypothetical protein F442_20472 [Phytophthora nicotianae P10297]|uniref:Uncharacterized protein n=1 Tax=Phytophthora nicotianae P10297 TaxID=1317064 RepID=W2Y778_PHYNI|nr:hypothetical protein F442_20472 [Phytophthora nicotianae P10297]
MAFGRGEHVRYSLKSTMWVGWEAAWKPDARFIKYEERVEAAQLSRTDGSIDTSTGTFALLASYEFLGDLARLEHGW